MRRALRTTVMGAAALLTAGLRGIAAARFVMRMLVLRRLFGLVAALAVTVSMHLGTVSLPGSAA